jgi:hypothetical protein
LNYASIPFCIGYFRDRVSLYARVIGLKCHALLGLTFLSRAGLDLNPMASCVVRNKGVYHYIQFIGRDVVSLAFYLAGLELQSFGSLPPTYLRLKITFINVQILGWLQWLKNVILAA